MAAHTRLLVSVAPIAVEFATIDAGLLDGSALTAIALGGAFVLRVATLLKPWWEPIIEARGQIGADRLHRRYEAEKRGPPHPRQR